MTNSKMLTLTAFNNFEADEIFDAPFFVPQVPPYLPRLAPYVTGEVPSHLDGASAWCLVAQLTGEPEEKAAELILFGTLWLSDRPHFVSDSPLIKGTPFRFNPPIYGPLKFYEIDQKRIAFEDESLLIYNKESGRPCQGVPHDAYNNTLAALQRYLLGSGQKADLWISHRLDADTSGLIIFAKSKNAASKMGKAFQENKVDKSYLALGEGRQKPEEHFECRAFIAKEGGHYVAREKEPGLAAHTVFQCLRDFDNNKYLFLAKPVTGRTHQIRLHLWHLGWPIMGDRFYQGNLQAPRLMLKSVGLSFPHPQSGQPITVTLA